MVLQLCGRVCRRISLLSLVFIDKAQFFLMDRRVRPKGLGSSPFFMKLQLEKVGVFLFYT
jgi:hypothetical protein